MAEPMHSQVEGQVPVKRRLKRPFSVTLLALGVLSIGLLNLSRLVQAVRLWEFLDALKGVSPLYLALTGLVWSLVGLPLAVGLWFGKRWAQRWMLAAALAYALYTWIDRIFVAHGPAFGLDSAWPFWVGFTLITLLLVFWILTRSKTKAYFRRNA